MPKRNIVVIGGSAGAVSGVTRLLGQLPAHLPASVCITVHLEASREEWLRSWLQKFSQLPVVCPVADEPLSEGKIYVARPDHHLILHPAVVRVSRGPRENLWRPAVDVLFRTAAVAYGTRVIAVLLSGELDDGTAGLKAIKTCGGVAIVQDPEDTPFNGMPSNAVANVEVDYCVPVPQIAPLLVQLAGQDAPPPLAIPQELREEASIADEGFSRIGAPEDATPLSCPECGGPLWINKNDPDEFRCLVGHLFRMDSLAEGLDRNLERALWAAIRMLEQRSHIAFTMLSRERGMDREQRARHYRSRAQETHSHAQRLRELVRQLRPLRRASEKSGEPSS